MKATLFFRQKKIVDHRHYPDREERYVFVDVETLISDFIADVRGAK